MPIEFHRATAEHVDEILRISIASITQLCIDDHSNDPKLLAEWLDNKTVKLMTASIEDPNNYMLVGFVGNKMVIAGGANLDGRILRNYIDPDHRFKGYGKAIMTAFEDHIRSIGLTKATLESSKTAFEFYKKLGWQLVEIDGNGKIEMMKLL